MIAIFGEATSLGNVAKTLKGKEINIATMTPGMANFLNNIDCPAEPLGNASGGLEHLSYQYGVNVLGALNTFERKNGLDRGEQKYIDTMLASYLYPRLSDLARLSLTLDRVKPNIVILQDDIMPINRVAALWAKHNKVPCLHVPHAIYQDIGRGPIGTDIHDIITASHLASAGPFQTEWYKKRGFPIANIRETGIPLFERWNDANLPPREKARELLGIENNGKPVVVYASTWPQHTNKRGMNDEWIMALDSVLEFAAKAPVELVIKCHPGGLDEGQQFHIDQMNKAGVKGTVTTNPGNLGICLKAADVLVAYASNTILDGAHFGTRLVAVRGYENEDEVINADPAKVGDAIAQALSGPPPDCKPLLDRWLVGGNASERIAQFALDLLNE